AHAVHYTFSSVHWHTLGISSAASGALWAIAIAAEVALFSGGGALVRRLGPARLIVLGGAGALIRWLAMGFDPPFFILLPLHGLHGLTFGATHLGAMHAIVRTVGQTRLASAQAIHAAVTGGVFMGAATLGAGPLYALAAGRAHWAMAALAALGLVAGLRLMTSMPARGLSPTARGREDQCARPRS